MTDTLSIFAADLRSFIRHSTAGSRGSEAAFNELALRLFRLQHRHLPVFQAWCDRRGATPGAVGSWTEIPAVPTSAFKDLELTAIPLADRVAVFHSSGTTGTMPSRHVHSAESLALYEASLGPWFRRNILEAPDAALDEFADEVAPSAGGIAFLSLTPPAASVPHSSLVHMLGRVVRDQGASDSVFGGRVGADGWELDLDRILFALRRSICANRPVALLGTAFNFVHLLDHLAANNIRYRLAAGSRVMETGGYKGRSRVVPREELHALIAARLGIPRSRIVTEYGMSELSSQAYDLGDGLRFPPWARVRIIDPETGREAPDGEPGIVRVVDLANVWSVMSVETGDLGVLHGDALTLAGRAAAAEPRGCSLMAA
jgi:hypothetical protein